MIEKIIEVIIVIFCIIGYYCMGFYVGKNHGSTEKFLVDFAKKQGWITPFRDKVVFYFFVRSPFTEAEIKNAITRSEKLLKVKNNLHYKQDLAFAIPYAQEWAISLDEAIEATIFAR